MTTVIPQPKVATLDASNTSVDMVNTAGSIEIAGDFTGPATVTQSLTGGSTTIDTFLVDSTFHTQANQLTFGLTGGNGPITIRWYPDAINTDVTDTRVLKKDKSHEG